MAFTPHLLRSTSARLFSRKLKHRRLMELLSRFQDRAREIRMIRRIREVLCLQAESITVFVNVAFLASDRSVKEVACVELDRRLSGRNLEHASCRRLIDAGGQTKPRAFAA